MVKAAGSLFLGGFGIYIDNVGRENDVIKVR